MSLQDDTDVVLGVITGHHGVRGWLKVKSYTRPNAQIFDYSVWNLSNTEKSVSIQKKVESVKRTSKTLLVKFAEMDSRALSETLIGCEIAVPRSQLESLEGGEFYWMDLIGLIVINQNDIKLGTVTSMMETGANDVAVISSSEEQEILLPWIPQVITEVDINSGILKVYWEVNEDEDKDDSLRCVP